MATGKQKTVSVILLNDKNYATWKVQCQMATTDDIEAEAISQTQLIVIMLRKNQLL